MKHNKTQNKNISNDSITKVYFCLDEPRVTVSFKCNEKLWNAFKTQIRAQKLSICHVLEPMIYGWLIGKVYLSNTIRPLKIENIHIERAVKRVRRYDVEGEVEDSKEYCFYCLKDGVRRVAVGLFRYNRTGEVYGLCRFHADFLLNSGVWSHV